MTTTETKKQWLVEGERNMKTVARACRDRWTAPTTVGLVGPLGSGKTTFVRSFVEELGGPPETVRSPTFALVQEYPDRTPPVIHADLYRTESAGEQETIGLEEFFGRGLVLVEWAANWKLGWPESTVTLVFEHVDRGTRRVSRFDAAPPEVQADLDARD